MPQIHEHDQIAVTNIDLNCSQVETFAVERSVPVPGIPGEANPLEIPRHQSQQVEGSFDHSKYFEVRYNGQPFRLRPGETRTFPRYLAEHFAKHLADHMLGKMEQQTGRTGLIQSATERPRMLAKIMRVEQWYLQDASPLPSQGMPDDPSVPTQDLGHVPAYHVGNLRQEPKTAEQILAEAGELPQGDMPGVNQPAPASTGEATPQDFSNQKEPAQTPNTPNTDPSLPPSNDIPNAPPIPQTPPNPTGPVTENSLPPTSPDPANVVNLAGTATTEPPAGALPGAVPGTNAADNAGQGGPNERTKADYIREAVNLGIEVNGRESVEELRSKIQSFATPR